MKNVLMKSVFYLIMICFLHANAQGQEQNRWIAPSEADTLTNPYSLEDSEIISKGMDLYMMVCATCHGERGDGAGGAGQSFNPPPADLTSDLIQEQSDGALFWKLSEGNPPGMLSYKNILSEEERWMIVTYLRRFTE